MYAVRRVTRPLKNLDDGRADLERRAILHRLDLVPCAAGCALVNRAVGGLDNLHVSGNEVGVGMGRTKKPFAIEMDHVVWFLGKAHTPIVARTRRDGYMR